MAKDDYYVIVYKVLVYLYAVFKRKKVFYESEFKTVILKGGINEDYLIDILNMMQDDGLISGLKFSKIWGNEMILIGTLSDMRITSKGIDHLIDNSKMQQIKKYIIESADIFASLIQLVFPK